MSTVRGILDASMIQQDQWVTGASASEVCTTPLGVLTNYTLLSLLKFLFSCISEIPNHLVN